jgi:hypothetical protein
VGLLPCGVRSGDSSGPSWCGILNRKRRRTFYRTTAPDVTPVQAQAHADGWCVVWRGRVMVRPPPSASSR